MVNGVGEPMEDDKSCQAAAVSWFMAPTGQAAIVFNVHFRGGAQAPAEEEAQCNIKVQKSVHLSSPEGCVMDLAFNSED